MNNMNNNRQWGGGVDQKKKERKGILIPFQSDVKVSNALQRPPLNKNK